ncbi:hypothetical protein [Nocardia jejuensis]|uniref:hypothetical protein n=1 Tax=Nocardia jejuensis TaxID=328049 RepID=UPI0008361A3D|nr:hypothetical protein [Nocardia jejuensis]
MFARSVRITLAAVGVAVALGSASAVAAADTPAPTNAELQSTLDRFTDPGVPTADKQQLMVGGDRRTGNIDKMNQGLANYGKIGFEVSGVQAGGDTANASVAIVSPHGTIPGIPMTWEHTAAGWQLSEGTACTILSMGKAPC